MIRLDPQTGEKDKILDIIGSAIDNDEYELECLFNNSSNKSNYNITHNNFMSILKRYKNNPEFEVKTNSRLAISFTESSKHRGVRILVKGMGAINSYCNSDSVAQILNSVDFEMKMRPKVNTNFIIIPNYNIKFNLKQEVNFNNDVARIKEIQRDWPQEMKNYRYKKTFSFIKKTGDFQVDISIVKNSTNIDRFVSVEEVLKNNNLLRSVVKPQDAKMPFSVWWQSMSKKPQEKVMVRNGVSYFKNIKESNVFYNNPIYEVEVEYIHNKTTVRPKFKNIESKKEYILKEFQAFFRQIGAVLQCIQGSSFIISNQEKAMVNRNFTKLVLNSINEDLLMTSKNSESEVNKLDDLHAKELKAQKRAQRGGYNLNSEGEIDFTDKIEGRIGDNKIVGGEDVDSENEDTTQDAENQGTRENSYFRVDTDDEEDITDDQTELTEDQKGGARQIADLKNKVSEQFYKKGIFFGPLIIDLSHNNAARLDPDALPDIATNTNININYLVTDKTDGERNLLYIDSKGVVYGIDRDSNIKSFGISLPSLKDTILDGEFVSRTEDNKPLNNFYIFDAYIYQGRCIMQLPFLYNRPDGRHNFIVEVAKYFTTGNNIIQNNPKMPFLIYKKDYLPGNSARTYTKLHADEKPLMAQNCERLLNKMNAAYGGFLEVGHLFPYKTDGLVFLPNNLGVFQTHEGRKVINPFMAARWNNNYKWKPAELLTIDFRVDFKRDLTTGKLAYEYRGDNKYLGVVLKSAVYQNRYGDNNLLNFYLLNSGIKPQSIPESFPFFAVDPFIGHFDSEGNMENNMSDALFLVDNNDNIVADNGDILTDGQIVECSYNKINKEERLRWHPHRVRADKQSPNNYLTAATSWYLINNPITRNSLSGKVNNEKEDNKEDKKGLENITYYSDNKETKFLTEPLNDFNSFVKKYLIERALTGYVRPRVLDLATGKFGDLSKYVFSGVSTFLGIEIGYDGLNNPVDGAATRVMNWANTNPAVNKLAERTVLLVGDATKNIANGDCVRDNLNKYYLDVLYGRAKGNTSKLQKLEGVALEGFDCVACMYAIHYMMNTESDLDSFLRNVSENLLDNGYFIGTCLDGMSILREMGKSTELTGVIGDKTVFKIKKLDDSPNAYKEITTGNKILVYYEKFAGQFAENLVNMSYLREKAKEHNLKLIEYRTLLEEPGNLLSQFEASNKKNAKIIKETEALQTWGSFNAYFIFQKVRD